MQALQSYENNDKIKTDGVPTEAECECCPLSEMCDGYEFEPNCWHNNKIKRVGAI